MSVFIPLSLHAGHGLLGLRGPAGERLFVSGASTAIYLATSCVEPLALGP